MVHKLYSLVRRITLRFAHFIARLTLGQAALLAVGVGGAGFGAYVMSTASSLATWLGGFLLFVFSYLVALQPALKDAADAAAKASQLLQVAGGLEDLITATKLRGILAAVASIHEEPPRSSRLPDLRGDVVSRALQSLVDYLGDGSKGFAFQAIEAGELTVLAVASSSPKTNAQWEQAVDDCGLLVLLEKVLETGDPLDLPDLTSTSTGLRDDAADRLEAVAIYSAAIASRYVSYGVLVAFSPQQIEHQSKWLVDLLGNLIAAGYASPIY